MMDLFSTMSPEVNLLPCDGETHYYARVITDAEAAHWFDVLLRDVPWQSDIVILFGKRITTARKVAWYGDPGCAYTYSGTTKQPLPWPPALQELKQLIEKASGASFNCCLLNLYQHGGEGMAWHSDDERELVPQGIIASVSLGEERRFLFRHKQDPKLKVAVQLEPGSLLLMRGSTQTHWLHSLPKSAGIKGARINLTFRQMIVSSRFMR